jgi:uncharacterized protein (TIGR03435 family)
MKENPLCSHKILFLLIAAYMVAGGRAAMGQASATTSSKTPVFDVVSIRPNSSGSNGGAWGVSQNKYFAKNTPLSRIILQAYLGQMAPSTDRLVGAPSWVMTDPYDINAKVDDATANSWKGLRQPEQVALAAPMLRTMLEDRCKLVVHTVPTEVQGYALVIGKHGMKMKETQPDEPAPTRVVKFEGGWMMVPIMPGDEKQSATYLQITMAQFTAFLSMGGKPIVDQTGLTGKYDFELPKIDTNPPEAGAGTPPAPLPDAAHMFNWGAIGLEMKPIKVPALNLVIDHIERPSEN